MGKKELEGADKIYNYLKEQNRPYSANDIHLNLHKEFGKTAVQKALDSLVESGSIKEKTYGKQKVYVVNQDDMPALDEAKFKELDLRINELNGELKAKMKELSESESLLRNVGSALTTEEVEAKLIELEKEIADMEKELSKSQAKGTVIVSKQEKERIEGEREKMIKAWKKRKRLATDILDAILEGYPKSKKELFDEIGIETDQDAGVDVNALKV